MWACLSERVTECGRTGRLGTCVRSCAHRAYTHVFYLGDLGPAFRLLKADTLAERPLLEPGAWAWAFHPALEMGSGITDASGWTREAWLEK